MIYWQKGLRKGQRMQELPDAFNKVLEAQRNGYR